MQKLMQMVPKRITCKSKMTYAPPPIPLPLFTFLVVYPWRLADQLQIGEREGGWGGGRWEKKHLKACKPRTENVSACFTKCFLWINCLTWALSQLPLTVHWHSRLVQKKVARKLSGHGGGGKELFIGGRFANPYTLQHWTDMLCSKFKTKVM